MLFACRCCQYWWFHRQQCLDNDKQQQGPGVPVRRLLCLLLLVVCFGFLGTATATPTRPPGVSSPSSAAMATGLAAGAAGMGVLAGAAYGYAYPPVFHHVGWRLCELSGGCRTFAGSKRQPVWRCIGVCQFNIHSVDCPSLQVAGVCPALSWCHPGTPSSQTPRTARTPRRTQDKSLQGPIVRWVKDLFGSAMGDGFLAGGVSHSGSVSETRGGTAVCVCVRVCVFVGSPISEQASLACDTCTCPAAGVFVQLHPLLPGA
jgi:hypothetical protein